MEDIETQRREQLIIERYPRYKKIRDEEKKNEFEDKHLTEKDVYEINQQLCTEFGFGKDSIKINELCCEKDLSKFNNVLEWTIHNHEEQIRLQAEDGITLEPFEFHRRAYGGDWFRFIENKKMVYGSLYNLFWYVYYRAVDDIHEYLHEKISYNIKWKKTPHDLDENGKPITFEIELKTVTKQKGMEDVVDEINYRIMWLENESLFFEILNKCKSLESFTGYRINYNNESGISREYDPSSDFIFCSADAARSVSFTNFLDDFKKIQKDSGELMKIIDEAKDYVKTEFEKVYNAVLEEYEKGELILTHDKPKRKILGHTEFFDDLEEIYSGKN